MKFEYNTDDYIRKINSGNSYFNTFLDKNTLAAGVLVLKPGEEDTQLPHESDEMYYILEGDGFLKIKNKKYKLKKGKAFFVPKDTEHYFFGNKTKLKVLYFFHTLSIHFWCLNGYQLVIKIYMLEIHILFFIFGRKIFLGINSRFHPLCLQLL